MSNFLTAIAAFFAVIGITVIVYVAAFAILFGVIGLVYWLICMGFGFEFNWWIVLGISGALIFLRLAFHFITGKNENS